MIYTPLTKKAMQLCFDAHKEQVDKSGMPYIFHPLILAEQMNTEETTIVALLHDVVEDTNIMLEDLRGMGFSHATLEAISLMTHEKGVPYMEYVAAIKKNPIARQVKIADLRHNSTLTRLDNVTQKDLDRVAKYKKALDYLTEEEK